MTKIDLTPLYLSSTGFDSLSSMLDTALSSGRSAADYPLYNIEATAEDHYAITLDVAGYRMDEIDIQVEKDVLTITGTKEQNAGQKKYLYQGFATRPFERKFNLNEYVEVTEARMNNGLLTINLVKEIPEAMKPRKIAISDSTKTLEHHSENEKAA